MGRKVHISHAGRSPRNTEVASGVARVPGMIAMPIPETFVGTKTARSMFLVQSTKKVSQRANMGKTKYSPFEEINQLQKEIMVYIDGWARAEKTPIPRSVIMKEFVARKVPHITVEWAVNALLRKGYIRRAYSGSNKTFYVQLRNV